MASATKKGGSAEAAAKRWRAGTEHYLSKFNPVAQRIHQKAAEMPNNSAEDAEKIVAMAISETQEFAKKYHEEEDE